MSATTCLLVTRNNRPPASSYLTTKAVPTYALPSLRVVSTRTVVKSICSAKVDCLIRSASARAMVQQSIPVGEISCPPGPRLRSQPTLPAQHGGHSYAKFPAIPLSAGRTPFACLAEVMTERPRTTAFPRDAIVLDKNPSSLPSAYDAAARLVDDVDGDCCRSLPSIGTAS